MNIDFNSWLIKESKFQEIEKIAKELNLDLSKFDKDEIMKGFETEKEHDGRMGKDIDVINGDRGKIIKILLAHLREDPHYYKKLSKANL